MRLLTRFRRKAAAEDARHVDRATAVIRADAYLNGFRDATEGVPFDPFAAAVIEELNMQSGGQNGLWLSLIGSNDD